MITPGMTQDGAGRRRFTTWAPFRKSLALHLLPPHERVLPLERTDGGYWSIDLEGVEEGTRYAVRLDGSRELPDPASHFQPEGVHHASAVVDHRLFEWHDAAWKGTNLESAVLYELHVGTFTPSGTFAAIEERLGALRDLGITIVEVMPVAQFPGGRNWGYDGVYPFAVQNTYGGPAGLKHLVDACHREGLGVILDVVYNHFGPEGNYLREFGPFFTDAYKTLWGSAINFDGPWSDAVRAFFLANALYWCDEFHLDGLRLDAIHAIFDMSAQPFLQQLTATIDRHEEETGRRFHLIAESDLNDARLLRSRRCGGFGMDAQWADDLHHAVETILTRQDTGYYADFGLAGHIAKAYSHGFVYDGQFSPYRHKTFGNSAAGCPGRQFVVCTQNHDQVGNRMLGERLVARVSFEATKLAASVILLSPFVPLLFMGEEYAETAPFLYFVSHGDPALVEAVRAGRQEEFKAFASQGELPDAAAESTFRTSTLNWEQRNKQPHRSMLDFYRTLLHLRRSLPALQHPDRESMTVQCSNVRRTMGVERWHGEDHVYFFFNFHDQAQTVLMEGGAGPWRRIFDSADQRWNGPGAWSPEGATQGNAITIGPTCAVLFHRDH